MSQNSVMNEEEDFCLDIGLVRAQNTKDKVGDPLDNLMTDSLPMKDLSISKDQQRPIFLENEDRWFENMKLLQFYQKYDMDSLGRFEYNNANAKVGQLVKTRTDAVLMGQIHKKPLDFTDLTFMPQMKEKVIGEGSLRRFKP